MQQTNPETIKDINPETKMATSMSKSEVNKNKPRMVGVYMQNILTRKLLVPYVSVGSNIKEILYNMLVSNLEGKCSAEGYIKPNTINIMNFSSGMIKSNNVEFDVMFKCMVCNPVEGMKFNVEVMNVTKAGVRCFYSSKDNSPVDVFISRDISYENEDFNQLQVGDKVQVRVLGTRYEINDDKISVICEIVKKLRVVKTINIEK